MCDFNPNTPIMTSKSLTPSPPAGAPLAGQNVAEGKMLLYTRVAPPKQPKKRSRGGCTYCKEKKKKCDEGRPSCSRCISHGVECSYEPIKPRQRQPRRREASATPTTAQSALPIDTVVEDREPSSMYEMCRRIAAASAAASSSSTAGQLPYSGSRAQTTTPNSMLSLPYHTRYPTGNKPDSFSPFYPPIPSQTADLLSPIDTHDRQSDDPNNQQPPTATNALTLTSHQPPYRAFIPPLTIPHFSPPNFIEMTPDPHRRALLFHFCRVLSHRIVLREETGNPFQRFVLPLTMREGEPTPVFWALLALSSGHKEYRLGGGDEGGEEEEKGKENAVWFHSMALRGLAGWIQKGEKERRNEMLATVMLLVYYECLVQKGHSNMVTGHLKGALTIMSTMPDPPDPTSTFLERAFRFYDVITALSNGAAPLSAAPQPGCLRPISPLGTPIPPPSPSLDSDSGPSSSLNDVDTLLGMTTTLWPIIHRLAELRALRSELDAAIAAQSAKAPSSTNTNTNVEVLRTALETAAKGIESALLRWHAKKPSGCAADEIDVDFSQPSSPANPSSASSPSSPSSTPSSFASVRVLPSSDPFEAHLSSIHHNSMAYRHAALVHLYRAILPPPSSSQASIRTQQIQHHAHLALTHCALVVAHGGPVAALLWPMFVAACEALTVGDRALATEVFAVVDKRQGMRNIGRAWEIVREVWKRRDRGEGGWREGELWRLVGEEMGVSVVFG